MFETSDQNKFYFFQPSENLFKSVETKKLQNLGFCGRDLTATPTQMGSADDSMNVVFTYSEDLHDQKSEGFHTIKAAKAAI